VSRRLKADHNSKGAALVEAAIVLPFALLILFGLLRVFLILYNLNYATFIMHRSIRDTITAMSRPPGQLDASGRPVPYQYLLAKNTYASLSSHGMNTNPSDIELCHAPFTPANCSCNLAKFEELIGPMPPPDVDHCLDSSLWIRQFVLIKVRTERIPFDIKLITHFYNGV